MPSIKAQSDSDIDISEYTQYRALTFRKDLFLSRTEITLCNRKQTGRVLSCFMVESFCQKLCTDIEAASGGDVFLAVIGLINIKSEDTGLQV